MKKTSALLFSLCSLFSMATFAQEPTADTAPKETAQTGSIKSLFGITLGEPMTIPRCTPGKPAIQTSEMCFIAAGNTSLFYGKTAQSIKIYFPKNTVPDGFVTPWLNAEVYKQRIVSMQVSTKGKTKQEPLYKALEAHLGKPDTYQTIESAESGDAQYSIGSLLANWATPQTETIFYGEYKSTKKGLLKAQLRIDFFEKLVNSL